MCTAMQSKICVFIDLDLYCSSSTIDAHHNLINTLNQHEFILELVPQTDLVS